MGKFIIAFAEGMSEITSLMFGIFCFALSSRYSKPNAQFPGYDGRSDEERNRSRFAGDLKTSNNG